MCCCLISVTLGQICWGRCSGVLTYIAVYHSVFFDTTSGGHQS